ncbi:dipeptidase [Gellertiella hungarica]|uniref:Membrane dipeptidase n=1 Tax=Gellertiella hungarica TaxID=1572859 RepID=A0A7W6J376_9HYPH|nr:dipeptidase [Gellertiella hungarica]MBB4063945.1 membrane dipeptidase [Gellertiella hungarica]
MQLIFDGHNDVLYRLHSHAKAGRDPVAEFVEGTTEGHIDGPRAQTGGLAGGFCAIYLSSPDLGHREPDERGHYEIPLPAPLSHLPSLASAMEIAAIAQRLDRAGAWALCRSVADIRKAMEAGRFAAVLHMEGCEAINSDLDELETFYAAGLRSLGPVWSRETIFGHGVPFAYPRDPDTGAGLTEAGFRLVKACNELGIVIDLAHLNEKGFWDVARTSRHPLVASHSNAHALTPVARNLTERQMDAIRDSRGIAGLNFAVTMLRADGREDAETPMEDLVRHIDFMVERMGIDCVGIGSDYDGATIPAAIGDASGSQALVEALRKAGYGEAELAKLCRENWLRVAGETWGA